MWGSNLLAPPITDALWLAIRNRLRVPTIEKILGLTDADIAAGKSRVYVEGDQPDTAEGTETQAWGRLVIVPGDPASDPPFTPGLQTTVSFLVRAELNSRPQAGAYRHNRHLQGMLREAFRLLQHWTGPITSNEVMIAGAVRAAAGWRPYPIDDTERTGTLMLSQRYLVDVAEALTAN